ncbi:dual specificity protein phosphatase 3-like [Ornithodoros turicata]|uniref:protein-serine/threonine phosphatase n=1 Tax=Ornithodoros turicata TaxID=34597 RepID=A0A2R5LAT6_9ACAR
MSTAYERNYGSVNLPVRSRFLPTKNNRHSQSGVSSSIPFSSRHDWKAPRFMSSIMARPEKKLCTIEEMLNIITAPSNGYYEIPTDPYNEVFSNIYISDGTTAMCTGLLRRLGITHVLNAAMGSDRSYCLINTNPAFYKPSGIKFHGVEALDLMSFRLDPYFEECADFIADGLASGGKVLVHCRQGISRSATLVLAYLMIKRGMTAQEALRVVRARREIIPNDGFLQQLCDLNERLQCI